MELIAIQQIVLSVTNTRENMEALKDLICHDKIGKITENIAAGNLSVSDGRKLKQITLQLYRHLYKDYKELEKAGVNDMVDDAMVLDIDIIEYEHQKEIETISKELTEKITEEVTKEVTKEKDGIINKLAAKLSNRQILMRSDTKSPQPFASWSNSL